VLDVVVDDAGGAGGRGGCPVGRLVGAGRAWAGGGDPATPLDGFATSGGGESDVAANVAPDTTTAKSTIAAAGHQRLSPRDKGTSHSRDLPVRALGTRYGRRQCEAQ
jgi:hypothetical protein